MKKKVLMITAGLICSLSTNVFAAKSFKTYQGEVIPISSIGYPLDRKISAKSFIDYAVFNTEAKDDNSFAYSIQFRTKTFRHKDTKLKISTVSELYKRSIKIVQGEFVGENNSTDEFRILYENGNLTELGKKYLDVNIENNKNLTINIKKDFKFVVFDPEDEDILNATEHNLYVIFETVFKPEESHDIVYCSSENGNNRYSQKIKIDKSRQNL